jgi:peptide methionine sulfoxide reductase MsrB
MERHTAMNNKETRAQLRERINSAALRFIPLEDMEKEGYGEYKCKV